MNITMQGKYQTRDGRAVRILATDFKAGATCIIGAIAMGDNNEIVGLWDGRGVVFGSCDHLDDLVPVTTKHEGFIVVGKDGFVWGRHVRDTPEEAANNGYREGDHIVPVHWED